MLDNFIKALIVGLGASIPLGPVGIMCIQKTISKGRHSGFSLGLGSSIADTFYAAIALFSLAFINDFIMANRVWVMLIGGVIICIIGIRIAITNPVRQLRQPKNIGSKKHVQEILQGLAVTITNPGALVLLLGLFAFVGITTGDSYEKYTVSVILAGVFLGTAAWWFVLTATINIFRKRFRLRQLLYINRISGVIIAVLGIISTAEGVIQLLIGE
ncbi:MAG: LysE family transporter [Bacteroidales bacterium]|nr:LysE family transporter [Bacteroidales bacterium]MDD4670446.1 LysE family transporter [Bacteroidales bacterium]